MEDGANKILTLFPQDDSADNLALGELVVGMMSIARPFSVLPCWNYFVNCFFGRKTLCSLLHDSLRYFCDGEWHFFIS